MNSTGVKARTWRGGLPTFLQIDWEHGNRFRSAVQVLVRVSSGNFLEMYDFMVFGYYAAAIGRTFFPTDSKRRLPARLKRFYGVSSPFDPLAADRVTNWSAN